MFNNKVFSPVCHVFDGVNVPLHFGFLTKESEDFFEGKGIVDLSFHNVYKITGSDRYSWLSKLTSQTFVENTVSYSKEALILSPQGKVIFALNVFVDSECIYVIEQCDLPLGLVSFNENAENIDQTFDNTVLEKLQTNNSSTHSNVSKDNVLNGFFDDTDLGNFFQKMIFMSDVNVENLNPKHLDSNFEIIAFTGDLDIDVLKNRVDSIANLVFVWSDPWPKMGAKNASYFNVDESSKLFDNLSLNDYVNFENTIVDSSHPASGVKLNLFVFETFGSERVFDLLTNVYNPCGIYAFESFKIVNYRPWGLNGVFPHEVDWLRTGVELNKGCYCGQETVARIVNVGKPARRLVKLYIDGYMNEIPTRNDLVYMDNEGEVSEIGRVLNVAIHHDEGSVALGLIKRNVDTDNASVLVGGLSASVEEIVSVSGRCTASPNTDRIMEVRRNRLR